MLLCRIIKLRTLHFNHKEMQIFFCRHFSFHKGCLKWFLKDNSSLLNLGYGKSPKQENSMVNCVRNVNMFSKGRMSYALDASLSLSL